MKESIVGIVCTIIAFGLLLIFERYNGFEVSVLFGLALLISKTWIKED